MLSLNCSFGSFAIQLSFSISKRLLPLVRILPFTLKSFAIERFDSGPADRLDRGPAERLDSGWLGILLGFERFVAKAERLEIGSSSFGRMRSSRRLKRGGCTPALTGYLDDPSNISLISLRYFNPRFSLIPFSISLIFSLNIYETRVRLCVNVLTRFPNFFYFCDIDLFLSDSFRFYSFFSARICLPLVS